MCVDVGINILKGSEVILKNEGDEKKNGICKTYFQISSVIFFIVGLLHLLRLFYRMDGCACWICYPSLGKYSWRFTRMVLGI